jgi:hypothetical protein
MIKSKLFKVAAVSSNTNSFGLHEVVLIAKDGTSFAVCKNDPPSVGFSVTLDIGGGAVNSSPHFNFEIPRPMQKAPINVVMEVWA